MNTVKTGAFIASLRKEKGMTQAELAEKLGVTNKAVSKWETGGSLPDISIFEPLARVLEVSINELLYGEKIAEEDFRRKSEDIIMEMLGTRKRLLMFRIMGEILIACACGLIGMYLGEVSLDQAQTAALIVIGVIVFFSGTWIAYYAANLQHRFN